jgi:hypothetical protein
MQLHEGEFRGSVDADEQMELAFFGPDFGDVDVKEADRVRLASAMPLDCGLATGVVSGSNPRSLAI